MPSIARRNLFHDPVRLAATVAGVAFAVVLMTAQIGAYRGFVNTASQIVDRSDVDVWIVGENTVNFDSVSPFPERLLHRARVIVGVARVEALVSAWGFMKLPAGRTELVQLVGFDPNVGVGGPWRMREGRAADVRHGGRLIVDASFLNRLGHVRVGERAEFYRRSAEVVGISEGVSSQTTYPIVFSSLREARRLSGYIEEDEVTFGLVWLDPSLDRPGRARTVDALKAIHGVDVYTRDEYRRLTQTYWSAETGIGIAFGVVILLGFVVGAVIVGQTIYASTVEHLRELGTLKAMGMRNGGLYRIVLAQALLSAVLGYGPGAAITLAIEAALERTGIRVDVTAALLGAMLAVTAGMCLLASVVSIRRITRIEPALVFRA